MRDPTKLRAFELADEVTIRVYRETRAFPNAQKLTAYSLQPKLPE